MNQGDAPGNEATAPLYTQPRMVALVMAVFVLILGIPAGLYALAGDWSVALGLVVAFLAMVAVSAYALRVATRSGRSRR